MTYFLSIYFCFQTGPPFFSLWWFHEVSSSGTSFSEVSGPGTLAAKSPVSILYSLPLMEQPAITLENASLMETLSHYYSLHLTKHFQLGKFLRSSHILRYTLLCLPEVKWYGAQWKESGWCHRLFGALELYNWQQVVNVLLMWKLQPPCPSAKVDSAPLPHTQCSVLAPMQLCLEPGYCIVNTMVHKP